MTPKTLLLPLRIALGLLTALVVLGAYAVLFVLSFISLLFGGNDVRR